MRLVLDGALLDAVQVAVCVMLGSMALFTLQYLRAGRWRRELLGWSVAVERLAFVGLLGLTVVRQYWRPLTAGDAGVYLISEAALLFAASVGVNLGNAVMWNLRRRRARQPKREDASASDGEQPRR